MPRSILSMIPSKKLVNQAFFAVIFCCAFFKPGYVLGKVFDRVVAKVNSEIITFSSIEERASILKQKYRSDLENHSEEEILRESLDMLVEEKLQLQQGKKMGLEVDDSAVDAALKDIEVKNGLEEGQLAVMLESEGRSIESYKNHIRDQILVSKITRFELGSRINISERKIAKYYHEKQKEFWEPGKARVRHILILSEKNAPANKKQEKIQQIKKILAELKDGKDFAEAAKEYSEDISASSGGDVGFVEKGKMVPEFENAVYRLKEGEISDVVETEYGYHLIKAEEIQKGRTLPLREVKNKIQYILSGKKQKSAFEDWMKELRESAFIEISLFDDPKKISSSDLLNSKNHHSQKDSSDYSNKFQKEETGLTADSDKKRQMQDKWEEMYKSVEKSKNRGTDQISSPLDSMEQKLKAIKKLRSQNKISEAEYQRRKQKVLDGL